MLNLIGKDVVRARINLLTNRQTKVYKHYSIYYVDNTFYVKKGNMIPIADESLDINGSRVLYSTPLNDKYDSWTPKGFPSGFQKPNEDNTNMLQLIWSKYKPKDKVRGAIKDGRFYINEDS